MAKENLGELFVDVMARLDKLDRDFDRAEEMAKKRSKDIEKKASINIGADKTVANVAKVLATMATVELATKGVQAGMEAVAAVSGLLSGNVEQAAQAAAELDRLMSSLPAGIGPAFQGIRGVVGELTGLNDEIRTLQRETQRLRRAEAQGKQFLDQQRAVNRELELLSIADPNERQRRSIELDIESRARQAGTNTSQSRASREGLVSDIRRAGELQLAELERQQAERARKDEERARRTEERQKAQLERQRQLEADAAFRRGEEVARVQAQVAATRLRAQGKDAEAQLSLLNDSFDSQIRIAERAGNKALAVALRQQRDAEIATLEQTATADVRREQFAAAFNPNLQVAGAEPAKKPRVVVDGQDEQTKLLKQLERNTRIRVVAAA